MATLPGVLLRGIRADQPAAGDVPAGTLYCVTDEDFIVEQSNGSTWLEYSPAAEDPATVKGPAVVVDDRIVTFDGTTGKSIQDGGSTIAAVVAAAVAASGDVDGPGVAVDDSLVTFDGTTGKLIQDSGKTIADLTADILKLIGPIVRAQKQPASNATVSTTSTSMADLDAALAVTFTARTSEVIVALCAYADLSTNTSQYIWGLRDNSNVMVTNSGGTITRSVDGGCFMMRFKVTGLTPGNSYTWKWCHGVLGGATGRTGWGPGSADPVGAAAGNFPAAVMEVWQA